MLKKDIAAPMCSIRKLQQVHKYYQIQKNFRKDIACMQMHLTIHLYCCMLYWVRHYKHTTVPSTVEPNGGGNYGNLMKKNLS